MTRQMLCNAIANRARRILESDPEIQQLSREANSEHECEVELYTCLNTLVPVMPKISKKDKDFIDFMRRAGLSEGDEN